MLYNKFTPNQPNFTTDSRWSSTLDNEYDTVPWNPRTVEMHTNKKRLIRGVSAKDPTVGVWTCIVKLNNKLII